MKNFSRLATVLIVSALFVAPFPTVAVGVGGTCSFDANCDSGLSCQSGMCAGTSGSGGAINMSLLQGYKTSIVNIINDILVPVLFAIAFIVFFWGAFKYFIWGAENEMEKAEGRKFAMWGIIGFVIILSIWGLVNLVTSTLALPNNNPPNTPRL